jgi:hypothetical protein
MSSAVMLLMSFLPLRRIVDGASCCRSSAAKRAAPEWAGWINRGEAASELLAAAHARSAPWK